MDEVARGCGGVAGEEVVRQVRREERLHSGLDCAYAMRMEGMRADSRAGMVAMSIVRCASAGGERRQIQ